MCSPYVRGARTELGLCTQTGLEYIPAVARRVHPSFPPLPAPRRAAPCGAWGEGSEAGGQRGNHQPDGRARGDGASGTVTARSRPRWHESLRPAPPQRQAEHAPPPAGWREEARRRIGAATLEKQKFQPQR